MKFRIDAAILRKHLEFVKPHRSRHIPILQAVHIVACEPDGSVFLSQHNSGRYIRTSLTAVRHPLRPAVGGEVVVDWFELYETLRGQKGIVSLEAVTVPGGEEGLQIVRRLEIAVEATGARVRLPLCEPEDLPCPFAPCPERPRYSLRAKAGKLIEVIERVLPVAAQDDCRPQMRGVHVRASTPDGVRIAATDAAHRAFVQDFGDPVRSEGDWEFVLPERFCKNLLRAAALGNGGRDAEIMLVADSWQQPHVDAREKERQAASGDELPGLPELKLGEGCVQATYGSAVIADTTPEGKYAAIERVTPDPEACGSRAVISRLKLVEALKAHRPQPCNGGQCKDAVSLHFARRRLGVVYRPGTDGVPISSILVSEEENTQELSMAFSAHELLVALQAVPDERVRLFTDRPLTPLLVTGCSSKAIVGPMLPEYVCPMDHPEWPIPTAHEQGIV